MSLKAGQKHVNNKTKNTFLLNQSPCNNQMKHEGMSEKVNTKAETTLTV